MSTLPEGWSYGENPKDGFIYRIGDVVWIITDDGKRVKILPHECEAVTTESK